MEGVRGQYFQNQHKGLAFGSLNFSDHQVLEVSSNNNADVLSQEVQNLALKDWTKGNGTVEGIKRPYYPLRPEAENCLFFMRYGWCKFGGNCRYNHPFKRRSQAYYYKEMAKLNEENLNRMAHVECKYYLTPEGSKHGKACRYNHSGRKTEKAPVLEFNFLGLPIRPGEKECPQYRRNGSCKYGSNCWFDHPDPSSMGEGFPLSGYTGWEDAMPFWPLAGPVTGFVPVETNMYQPAQCAQYSEWIGYQVPLENCEAPIYTTSGGIPSKPPPVSSKAPDVKPSQQQQWLPKPNRQPEQVSGKASLVKSSQQQQQHPKPNREERKSGFGVHHCKTFMCPVNDKGLPLRPGTEFCAFYNRYGVCKHGAGCKFDHTVPQVKPVPAAESEAAQLPDPTTEDNN